MQLTRPLVESSEHSKTPASAFSGLEYWNGVLEWSTGMEYWTEVLDWSAGFLSFSGVIYLCTVLLSMCITN
jgi:hypothetical protein